MANASLVDTCRGKIRGTQSHGIHTFRGIPYAADTGGLNRFQPPKPFFWAGVRDALTCGSRAPQNGSAASLPFLAWLDDRTPASENCLVLNVFTPSVGDGGRRPVMVYLHGGGFTISSSGAPGLDGGNLAQRDVVVVTVNHRLNLFGHLYLGDADGGRYAEAGNAGMLDLVAALLWVRDNAARFGGDPGNVTIFGQSGGGSKVAVLMAMPQARGLFHRAIIQSASSLLTMATMDEAERNTHHFLAQLGLARSRLGDLVDIRSDSLLKAMSAAIKASGGVDNYRPVVDGRALSCQPFDAAAVQASAQVPLLTGWCENEQRLNFAPMPHIYRQGEQEAVAGVASVVGIPQDHAASLLEVYRSGRPQDTPGDLYAQICGDHRYRRTVTRAAELQLLHGGAPVYMYQLTWKTPVQGGLLRTPHTLCIPFVFANVDAASGITGLDPDRYRLQDEMSAAWVAFARAGSADHAGLPAWPRFSAEQRHTMVFDRRTAIVGDPSRAERLALDTCPRYIAAVAQGVLRNASAP